jgi:hypothetical protein
MVVPFQKLILALLYRVRESPGTPPFLVDDIGLAGGEKSLDPIPSLRCLVRAYHRAQYYYKFVMTQMFPYCE